MTLAWKPIRQLLLILFLLWHGAAVMIFSIPRDAQDPLALWSRTALLPSFSPYILVTSQWQLWNLFSPDPQRRVTTYRIEVQVEDGSWRPLKEIEPGTYSIFRHATHFKMYGGILDEFSAHRQQVADRFLKLLCMEEVLAPGQAIRLLYKFYVIPQLPSPASAEWWHEWSPMPQEYIGHETRCPLPL